MRVWELPLDNSESEVEKKERAHEDENHKEDHHPLREALFQINHDLAPAFERHDLEGLKQSWPNVIETSHPMVWVRSPGWLASVAHRTGLTPSTEVLLEQTLLDVWRSVDLATAVDASLVEHSSPEMHSCDGEDDLEYEENKGSVP